MRERVDVRPRPVEALLRHHPVDGDGPRVVLGTLLGLWSGLFVCSLLGKVERVLVYSTVEPSLRARMVFR